MFDSENEINQKLGSCIVVKDHRPFFVVGANSRRSVLGAFKDGNREEATIELNDPTLDFKNLGERLGYVDIRSVGRKAVRETMYLMRQPRRRSIQGLHDNNIYVSSPHDPDSEVSQLSFHHIYQENGDNLCSTFRGSYQTVRDIRRAFSNDPRLFSVAFDRNWALERSKDGTGPDFNVMYKMTKVGYSEDLHRLRISQKYKFLEKDLRTVEELRA